MKPHPGWVHHEWLKDRQQLGIYVLHEEAATLQKPPSESNTYSLYKTYLNRQMINLYLYHNLRKVLNYLKMEHKCENL